MTSIKNSAQIYLDSKKQKMGITPGSAKTDFAVNHDGCAHALVSEEAQEILQRLKFFNQILLMLRLAYDT